MSGVWKAYQRRLTASAGVRLSPKQLCSLDRAVVVFVDGDIVRVRYSNNGAIEDIDRPDLLIEH